MLAEFRNRETYPFWFEVAPLVLTTIILMVQFFGFEDFTPHVPLVIGICITGIFMSLKGKSWQGMEVKMYRVMKVALPSVMILMCVGMVIASWIASGTVPTILNFGLGIMSPTIFLPAACVLGTLVSLATGTSWGTVGTVGLAVMGIGTALGIPEWWTAGAVVSGAFFGDKMSPLSDTTNLTPAVTDTDLVSHIKSMLPNTVPAYLIALAIYGWISSDYGANLASTPEIRETLQHTIQTNFKLSWITLIPAVFVVVMGFRRYSVIGTLCTGVFLGALIAIFFQGFDVAKISNILMNGYKAETGQEYVDKLLSKGGILSMGWVITMMLLSLAFIGVLEHYGTFRAILGKLARLTQSRFSLVATSAAAVLAVGVIAGEVYTSIVLPGRLMKNKFTELGYDRTILSRTIEDWGTLISPLIPWNNGGAFVSSTLGLSAFVYAPFALFCWLSPLVGLIYAAFGWFMPMDPAGPQPGMADEDMEEIAADADSYLT
ncbi:MAG: Na+/H+ antiporter NhaC [Lautropia sp.]|nr:Na+/H+ antiporter NhaC [Lautropia sp.]